MLREISGVKVDYLVVCDAKTLEPLTSVKGDVALLGAIQTGNIRLIDNLLVKRSL